MPDTGTEREQERQAARANLWARDASASRVAWIWWIILLGNMALFAWGLQASGGVNNYSFIPLTCVWIGAFSCCMIFHVEMLKRTVALRAEIETLRRELEARTGPRP